MPLRVDFTLAPEQVREAYDSVGSEIAEEEKMDKFGEDPHRYPFFSGSLSPVRKMDISTLSGQYGVDAGEMCKVPEQIYRSISPIALIVLQDEPHNIYARLNNRDNKNYNLNFIRDFQKQELTYSKQVADTLNIPYWSCNPFAKQNNIYEFVGDILEKETN